MLSHFVAKLSPFTDVSLPQQVLAETVFSGGGQTLTELLPEISLPFQKYPELGSTASDHEINDFSI